MLNGTDLGMSFLCPLGRDTWNNSKTELSSCGMLKVGSVSTQSPPCLPRIFWELCCWLLYTDPHSPWELSPHAELKGEIPVQANHHSRKVAPKSPSQSPSIFSYLFPSTIHTFFVEKKTLLVLCKTIWPCTAWVFQGRRRKREQIL